MRVQQGLALVAEFEALGQTSHEDLMTQLTNDIVMTQFDHHRLQGLLMLMRSRSKANPRSLDALERGLKRAQTVASDSIPADVVTMNSTVGLRKLATGQRVSLTLVFPDAPRRNGCCVPVLSSLGLALLGCRVGQVIQTFEPGGAQEHLIEDVEFQPEAKGNFFM